MPRIIITGGPLTGKTTEAQRLSAEHGITNVRSTDEVKDLGWSEASAAASLWFDAPGDWIIEGVAVPRALRKWLAANPQKQFETGTEILVLNKPHKPLSKGQQTMTTGLHTVLSEIAPQLKRRGARFIYGTVQHSASDNCN